MLERATVTRDLALQRLDRPRQLVAAATRGTPCLTQLARAAQQVGSRATSLFSAGREQCSAQRGFPLVHSLGEPTALVDALAQHFRAAQHASAARQPVAHLRRLRRSKADLAPDIAPSPCQLTRLARRGIRVAVDFRQLALQPFRVGAQAGGGGNAIRLAVEAIGEVVRSAQCSFEVGRRFRGRYRSGGDAPPRVVAQRTRREQIGLAERRPHRLVGQAIAFVRGRPLLQVSPAPLDVGPSGRLVVHLARESIDRFRRRKRHARQLLRLASPRIEVAHTVGQSLTQGRDLGVQLLDPHRHIGDESSLVDGGAQGAVIGRIGQSILAFAKLAQLGPPLLEPQADIARRRVERRAALREGAHCRLCAHTETGALEVGRVAGQADCRCKARHFRLARLQLGAALGQIEERLAVLTEAGVNALDRFAVEGE